MNKVKAISKFPGFEPDDVLIRNKVSGLFEYAYNEQADSPEVDSLYTAISENKPTLALKDIVENMLFFVDISEYEQRTPQEVNDKIAELNNAIISIKDEEEEGLLEDKNINVRAAVTTWQNMIWILEWQQGRRNDI